MTHRGSRGKAPAHRDAACEATADRREVVLLGNVSTEIELPDKNNLGKKKKIDRSDFFGSVSDYPFTPRRPPAASAYLRCWIIVRGQADAVIVLYSFVYLLLRSLPQEFSSLSYAGYKYPREGAG